jgi:hypothetical protein
MLCYVLSLLILCRSVDLLRSVLAARDAGAVYSIVFVGINGVGEHSYIQAPLCTLSLGLDYHEYFVIRAALRVVAAITACAPRSCSC